MQKEGTPRFLKHHSQPVKGVAFSPRDRYLFASGGADGKVNLYSSAATSSYELLIGYQLTSSGITRNINGVRFTSDGRKILAATTARRLAVLDVERGEQIQCFDNCAFSAKERVPLATDPNCPHLAVCCNTNGKGLTFFDLRMPLPLDFVPDLHSSVIRDLTFLDNSWPFVKSHQSGVVSISVDGSCKVTTLDGRTSSCFEVGHVSNCVAVTPESYGTSRENGFNSLMMVGGEFITRFRPECQSVERTEPKSEKLVSDQVWKMKYTSNGSLLYIACEDGSVRRYRRYPDGHHKFLGEVYAHKGEIHDLDISPYDEFVVTASKDKHVGILCLGAPNHGWTGYCQLT